MNVLELDYAHQNCKGDEQDPVPDPKRAWKIQGKGARDVGDHLTLKNRRKVRHYLIGQNSLIQAYSKPACYVRSDIWV